MAVRVSCDGCGATIEIVQPGQLPDPEKFLLHKRLKHPYEFMPELAVFAVMIWVVLQGVWRML